ncbi:adenylate kinase [Alphaproteobacteria bacterium]|nr:adenylate kinase [Alphaproteobacteria bacterium]GHS95625.1 adenylate kinase [Alphaproteobacteria bacterium]
MRERSVLIFIGPPGCGKGTQALLVCERFSFSAFSTGNAIRKEIESGSDFGKELQKDSSAGALVSDEFVTKMVQKVIESSGANRILFDGFPRNLTQAESLEKILAPREEAIGVFHFCIEDKLVVDRILGRFACSRCQKEYNDKTMKPVVEGVCDRCGNKDFTRRQDDTLETVKSRLKNYKELTEPVVQFYETRGVVSEIDASLDVEAVFEQISAVLQNVVG